MAKESETFFSQIRLKRMKKIFIDNLQMETQTVFAENGNINIYPCSFEQGQHILAGGLREARQKGRMVTGEDGTSLFHAYAKDSGSRYRELYRTAHGCVKETLEDVIFQLRFPKRLGRAIIGELFIEEADELEAFIRTRRTETQW